MDSTATIVYEGKMVAKGLRFGIVCSRFNEFFVSKLLGGAIDCILRHEGQGDDIEVAWVPGSYEIPIVARRLAASCRCDGSSFNAMSRLASIVRRTGGPRSKIHPASR